MAYSTQAWPSPRSTSVERFLSRHREPQPALWEKHGPPAQPEPLPEPSLPEPLLPEPLPEPAAPITVHCEEDGPPKPVMLVTGASSGVGAAMVRYYAVRGYKVAALARREELLAEVCAGLEGAIPIPCDVSDREQVRGAVARVQAELGAVEVLVNNAAVSHDGKPFWELSLDDVDRCVDINTKGTMYVTHCVLQGMIAANRGWIFAVASVAGTWGIPNEACYVASKHGMVGFMDSVANETRSTNIVVATICPGGIDTPFWTNDHPYGGNKSHAAGQLSMLIQPQEIIDLLDYQLSLPTNRVLKRVVFFPKGEWH